MVNRVLLLVTLGVVCYIAYEVAPADSPQRSQSAAAPPATAAPAPASPSAAPTSPPTPPPATASPTTTATPSTSAPPLATSSSPSPAEAAPSSSDEAYVAVVGACGFPPVTPQEAAARFGGDPRYWARGDANGIVHRNFVWQFRSYGTEYLQFFVPGHCMVDIPEGRIFAGGYVNSDDLVLYWTTS